MQKEWGKPNSACLCIKVVVEIVLSNMGGGHARRAMTSKFDVGVGWAVVAIPYTNYVQYEMCCARALMTGCTRYYRSGVVVWSCLLAIVCVCVHTHAALTASVARPV